MKKIKRMYIIIILIFISIISRYKFRNIEREETGQTAKKENDGALQNFHLCGCNMARSGNKATEI